MYQSKPHIDKPKTSTLLPSPAGGREGGGGDLVPNMPRYVCPKVKDMGLLSASME